MPTHVLQMLEAERRRQFAGLAGTRLDGVLPVRQALVDAALAQAPRWPSPIETVRIRIAAGNRIHVAATVRLLGFKTRLGVSLRLAPALDDGQVRLFLEDRSLVSSALSWLGPLLGRLPHGISLQGNQILVDVRAAAARQGFGDLAALLSAASFETEEGVLWINARVDVPDAAPGAGVDDRSAAGEAAPAGTAADVAQAPRARRAPLPFGADDLVTWLTGLRVDADVRVDERLANALVAAAHADAGARAGESGSAAEALAAAVRRPVLRFEAGAVRVSAGADLRPQADAAGPRNA